MLGRTFDQRGDGGGAADAAEFAELEGDVAGGLEALLGSFLHAVMDDAVEGGRNFAIGGGEFGRLVVEDGGHDVGAAFAVEGATAGEHFIEDYAETENVAARVGGFAANLLG